MRLYSLENLRVKVAALQQQGITAHMWSGCYRMPSPTLTGSLVRDLQLIEEVVGAGEIAISDHRSSWPTTQVFFSLSRLMCRLKINIVYCNHILSFFVHQVLDKP